MGSSNTRGLQIPDDVVGDAKFSNGPNCGRAHLLIHSLGLANVSHLLLRQVRVCGMIHLATYGWPPGRYAQAQGYYRQMDKQTSSDMYLAPTWHPVPIAS